jgi:hypothetical protein
MCAFWLTTNASHYWDSPAGSYLLLTLLTGGQAIACLKLESDKVMFNWSSCVSCNAMQGLGTAACRADIHVRNVVVIITIITVIVTASPSSSSSSSTRYQQNQAVNLGMT